MEQRIFCPHRFDGRHLHREVMLCLRTGRIDAIVAAVFDTSFRPSALPRSGNWVRSADDATAVLAELVPAAEAR